IGYSVLVILAATLRALNSFPTRRSSDLGRFISVAYTSVYSNPQAARRLAANRWEVGHVSNNVYDVIVVGAGNAALCAAIAARQRSEEHTSELQSRENLVCRLLLEKKKKT